MKRISLSVLFAVTVLRLAAAEPSTNNIPRGTNAVPRGNLLITADFFEYSSSNKVAIYTGNVRVVDPPTTTNELPTILTCKIMTVKLPAEGGKIESIVADQNVIIDQGPSHATGARAIYKAETDVVELSGNPILITTNGTLRGDLIILDRRNNKLRATGHVRMDIPQNSVGQGGGGVFSPKPAVVKPTNSVPVKSNP